MGVCWWVFVLTTRGRDRGRRSFASRPDLRPAVVRFSGEKIEKLGKKVASLEYDLAEAVRNLKVWRRTSNIGSHT